MQTEYLISPRALHADPSILVFDCRFSLMDPDAGRRQYESAHIPGARYADLNRDLSDRPGDGGRHPLPPRDALADRLRKWGINHDSRIVCYDDSTGAFAARLWWLMRWLGHADVLLLDGGLDAWVAAGFATEANEPRPIPGNFEAGSALTRDCTADDILNANGQLVDARDEARFRGESEPIDPVAGHIPGAVCAPFTGNLVDGRFRDSEALRARFTTLGLDPDSDIVCYCGSGVTAAHNILALLVAGYPEPVLYAGSWSGWITDSTRPIARA